MGLNDQKPPQDTVPFTGSPFSKAGVLKATAVNNLQFKNWQDQAPAPLSRTKRKCSRIF